jgi:hypothetical protein
VSTPKGILFADPQVKPMGQQAGAYLLFYLTGTITPVNVYADALLTTPLSQVPGATQPSCTADSAGRFNPIYLNPATIYRVQMYTQAGVKLEDTDPYVPPGIANQANLGAILYPQTAAELTAGVTPVNYLCPPGCPDRFGTNTMPGATDMTAAVQNAIDSCDRYIGSAGAIYGVTTVTFPARGPHYVDFNGSTIRGIATSAQSCVVAIKSNGNSSTLGATVFVDYRVDSLGVTTPNPNYTCGTWWYNSVGGSQFITFFGCQHQYLTRGMVYGALPGSSPSGGLQSENKIYGFQTKGVENPLYCNAQAGFLHLSDPILYSGHEGWTVAPSYTMARAVEIVSCAVFAQGGEIQIAASNLGFAADLQSCVLVGMNIETANPLQIVGDGVKIYGCSCAVDVASISAFSVKSGVTGTLTLDGSRFSRPATLGSFDGSPLVNATAAGVPFTTLMMNTQSFEWAWKLVGGTARLVIGGSVVYKNHRLFISTAGSDQNVYTINSPGDSLLDGLGFGFDRLGYTTTGWVLNLVSGGGSTFTNTTNAGPPGYLASQLTLHATGNFSTARLTTTTNLASIQGSALRVEPNELYWVSCWLKISAGTDARLGCEFWTLAGAALTSLYAADGTGIGNGVWRIVEGPINVPATAAYMSPSVYANTADVQITDMRIRRAN